MQSSLRLAIPSKGALDTDTRAFLAASGLKVSRPNERQYVGNIPSVPHISVLFQRAPDIFTKVREGSADLGITGYDVVREMGVDHDDVITIRERLGYGKCQLVLAVPDSWLDVNSIEDLADLTLSFKEKGRELRIATKYPNLTRQWLYQKRVIYFSLVAAHGAMEAAPSMGYADAIADVTSTGTTLRENRLKPISGGTMLDSQACLIGNKRLLARDPEKLNTTKLMLELIEAQMEAKKYISISANVQGNSDDEVGKSLMQDRELAGVAGLRGPTVSKVYSGGGESNWYAVTIVVEEKRLMDAVKHLRNAGGQDITVFSPKYVFREKSQNYLEFLEKLDLDGKFEEVARA